MRILYLGNNWTGWQILRWLKSNNNQIVGLVLHSPDGQKYGKEIIKTAGVDSSNIFFGSELHNPDVIKQIQVLQPDIGLSVYFGYLLDPIFIDIFPKGIINLHPAYLPYNRGSYPNVWSIIDGTPAGVTMHYIDEGIDTGDIIAQEKVPVEVTDTGKSLYYKLEKASVDLFLNTWPKVLTDDQNRISQKKGEGTYHSTEEINEINFIDLDYDYSAKELINIIRARTFPPYPGPYFVSNGRKVYVRIELSYEDDFLEGK